MSRIDRIKQKIRELEEEVEKLEDQPASEEFWENLLTGPETVTVHKVEAHINYGQKSGYMVYTNRIDDFGRLDRLHHVGYYVDAFRHTDDSGGYNGSRFWIEHL